MSPKHASFPEAIGLFFKNYVNFTGRSTRSEYWWYVLFNFIVSFVLSFIASALGMSDAYGNSALSSIWLLVIFLPGLALSVRRLHDIGKSWLSMFIVLIPLAGIIIYIVWMCQPSDTDNLWGPSADTLQYGGGMGGFGQPNGGAYNPNQPYNPNQGYNGGYDPNQGYNNGGYNPNQGYNGGYDPNQGYNNGGYNPNQGYNGGYDPNNPNNNNF